MGENVIAQKVAGKMMLGFRQDVKLHDALTEREYEVLLCIGHGFTNKEIGEKCIKTVKTHVSHILESLR